MHIEQKGERMADLIDRQMAIDALCKSECGWNNAECRHKDDTDFCVTCDNVKIIKFLPSIHSEHKTGQWIQLTCDSAEWWCCSECNGRVQMNPWAKYNYCPNCGADMRSEQNE